MRRRDCQIQLSGPGVWLDRAQLTFPAPHSSFHRLRWLFIPLRTPCSSWSKDYLGNSPRFPCCLQGRSQLWSVCSKSVLCKKCALTVRLTHSGGNFFLQEITDGSISCKFAATEEEKGHSDTFEALGGIIGNCKHESMSFLGNDCN